MKIIIIKNIPSETRKNEIETLIVSMLKGRFWQKSGTLASLKLLEVSDAKNSFIEYHYIAAIEPEEAAKRIVKALNGKEAFGAKLDAHEYAVRNWRNDLRQKTMAAKQKGVDKRNKDRRRSGQMAALINK